MKLTLTIEMESIQELIKLLVPGTIPVKAEQSILTPKTRKLKDPDTGDIHTVSQPCVTHMSHPVTYTKEELEIKCRSCGNPVKQFFKNKTSYYCSKKCYQKVYWRQWYKKHPYISKKKTINEEKVKGLLDKIKKEIPIKETERSPHTFLVQ